MRIASVSHAVIAVRMIALGILGLIKGHFTPLWDPVPQGAAALAYLCAFISMVCGIGLFWQRTASAAARVLLAYLLIWLVRMRVPGIILAPTVEFWWSACKAAVMAAGVAVAITFQWSAPIVSAALTAGAWAVAESYRGMPTIAVDRASTG